MYKYVIGVIGSVGWCILMAVTWSKDESGYIRITWLIIQGIFSVLFIMLLCIAGYIYE